MLQCTSAKPSQMICYINTDTRQLAAINPPILEVPNLSEKHKLTNINQTFPLKKKEYLVYCFSLFTLETGKGLSKKVTQLLMAFDHIHFSKEPLNKTLNANSRLTPNVTYSHQNEQRFAFSKVRGRERRRNIQKNSITYLLMRNQKQK